MYKIAINSSRVCQKEKRRKYIGKWYFRAKRGILDYLEKNVYEKSLLCQLSLELVPLVTLKTTR